MDSHAKNRNRRTEGRVESHEGAIISYCLTDYRRSTDGYQISRLKFVEEHGCFTVGGR